MHFKKQYQLAGLILIGIFVLMGCASNESTNSSPHLDDNVPAKAIEPTVQLEGTGKFITPENIAQLETVGIWGNGRANAVHFSPNGQILAVLTTIGVNLFDVESWEERRYIPFSTSVQQADFAPNGRFLAITSFNNQQIEVWDLEDNNWVKMPELGDSANLQALFTADSAHLVINERTKIGVWNLIEGELVTKMDAPENGAFGQMIVSPSDDTVAVSFLSDRGEQILVRSLQAAGEPQVLDMETAQQIEWIRFSEDGQYLVAVLSEGAFAEAYDVNVWSTENWERLSSFVVAGGMNPSTWMLSPNGRLLSVLIGHKEIGVWDLFERSDPIILPALNLHPLTDMTFSPNNKLLFIATSDGQIQQWDVSSQTKVGQSSMADKPLADISLSVDGSLLAFVVDDGMVEVWDEALASQQIAFSQFGFGEVNGIAYSANGRFLAAASSNGNVSVWDDVQQIPIATFNQPNTNIDSVAFTPDGRRLATGAGQRLGPIAFDDSVKVWNTEEQTLAFKLAGEGEDVPGCSFYRNSVFYSPDGSYVAAASHDFTVDLWLAETGEHIHKFPPHKDAVLSVAFSPDGNYLATASEDITTRVWRLPDFELAHEFTGRLGGMWSLAFTPDSQTIIVGDSSGLIQQWNLDDGRFIKAFQGEKNKVSNLAVSPDGRLLISGGEGSAVNIWSVESGSLLQQLPSHAGVVLAVAFSPDGETIVTGSRDNTMRVWQLAFE